MELIPVKNEANVIVLLICTYRDITSLKVKKNNPNRVGLLDVAGERGEGGGESSCTF